MDTQLTPGQLAPELIDEMLLELQRVFEQVRPYILENAGKITSTDKADGSMVTAADIEVERIVTDAMATKFPAVSVFGEESGYEDNLPSVCWLIDPIDGTSSFMQNIPFFTCMAVLIVDKEAVASIIYNPSSGDIFTAQKDKGAYKNGVRLNLAVQPVAPTAYCKGRFIEALNNMLLPKSVNCEKHLSGGGYDFCAVADGTIAARFSLLSGGYPHDYAPGVLLVQEAGGVIIPVKEVAKPYMLRTFVACHPELESIIRENVAMILELEETLGS